MRKKAASIALQAMFLANMLTLTISLRTTQASLGAILYADPAESTVYKGDSFTININIDNVVDLFSYETKLGFNRTVLEPVAVEEGPFIKDQTSSPIGTFFLQMIEDDFVYVACVSLGNYSGVSGSGTLFNVTFNAIGAGTSDLQIYDSILLDSSVTEMSHATADGTVLAVILGDVNGDGIVNVLDLTIVSMAYGMFKGEPNYNPEADLNDDGIVDIRDLAIVARNLG